MVRYIRILEKKGEEITIARGYQVELDKRYNLNSCINKGTKVLKNISKVHTRTVGFAIYKVKDNPLEAAKHIEILHTTVLEQYKHLKLNIGEE